MNTPQPLPPQRCAAHHITHLALGDCLQGLDEGHLRLLVWCGIKVGHGLAHKRLDHLGAAKQQRSREAQLQNWLLVVLCLLGRLGG